MAHTGLSRCLLTTMSSRTMVAGAVHQVSVLVASLSLTHLSNRKSLTQPAPTFEHGVPNLLQFQMIIFMTLGTCQRLFKRVYKSKSVALKILMSQTSNTTQNQSNAQNIPLKRRPKRSSVRQKQRLRMAPF